MYQQQKFASLEQKGNAMTHSELNKYFDNASTTWPKPPQVGAAIVECMQLLQGSPGRSGSGPLAGLVPDTRAAIARLFNIREPSRIAFSFNATGAINLGIQGYLNRGDRVVTTSMEHNAVCRPLHVLKRYRGVSFDTVPASPEGLVDLDALERELEKPTKLVIVNHASNVTGTVNAIEPIGRLAKRHGATFMVDASKTAGVVDIDVQRDHIDILACPGHKGLLGPTGTGLCYLAPELDVRPVLFGGTGNLSELEYMPENAPERFEAGTLNFHGLAGLRAAIEYLMTRGLADIRRRETEICARTLAGLRSIPGLKLHGTTSADGRMPLFSLTVAGHAPDAAGKNLAERHGIVARAGLHCAPWAHKTIGTFPAGTVRVSPGIFHTDEEIDLLIEALAETVGELGARH
jgi:cysteine desulfurase / selenocysteine lyase